jgi:hypothetical protein
MLFYRLYVVLFLYYFYLLVYAYSTPQYAVLSTKQITHGDIQHTKRSNIPTIYSN